MNKRIKVIAGLGIILATLYFGYSAVTESLTYYRGVDTVSNNMDYYTTHRVKMIGDIANGSFRRAEGGYMFEMGLNKSVIGVRYQGVLPQTFNNSGRVVVIGTVRDGIFQASEMNVKCPTKYVP